MASNDNKWTAICMAIALGGVAGMGYTANKAFDAGQEAGIMEGHNDVIFSLGTESIMCIPARDVNDNIVATAGNDCETIYKTYLRISDEFDYGEDRKFEYAKFWRKWFSNN